MLSVLKINNENYSIEQQLKFCFNEIIRHSTAFIKIVDSKLKRNTKKLTLNFI